MSLAIAVALAAGACEPQAPPPSQAGSAAPVADDGASREVLDRIVRAETSLAYHGVRTVSRGPAGASREARLQVEHTADGRTTVCWTPPEGGGERRRWRADSRHPWVNRPDLLLRNYRVTAEPGAAQPVAWRDARSVRIEPRRPGRPSLHLVVDAETWLVLAETGRGFDGEEWMRARFESIEYGDPAGAPAADPVESLQTSRTAAPPAGLRPLVATVLPEGFERLGARTSECSGGAWVEDFSDGLAAFSVLQRPVDPGTAVAGEREREVQRRRLPAGWSLSGRVDGVEVEVAGNLPESDLLGVFGGLRAAAQ